MIRILIIICFIFSAYITLAQKKSVKATRILFVFDASNSMKNMHQNLTRMEGAKQLFFKFVDTLAKDKSFQFALRMYGHTVKYPPGNCGDSKLVVPFSSNNLNLIKQKVKEAKPTGITPIEHSLTQAANDFPDNKANNIVIIITDGIEECGGDPCKARQKLMEKGIIFKPFIIGIGLSIDQIKTFECVGTYFDYDSDETFGDITKIIQQQKLNKTSAQVNLLDSKSLPTETDVNMTFYDVKTGKYKYNYMHTLNYKVLPDTLYLDDFPTYKVVVHTIPPVQSEEAKLTSGKHTIIPVDAPQGYFSVNRPAGVYNYNEKVKVVVRKNGSMETINVQQINSTDKYIVGKYDIEILTLPRILISGNEILQSAHKVVDIPNAGMLQIKCIEAGDGAILVQRGDERLEWVTNLGTAGIQTYYLQPGNYVAVWRARSLKGSIYTIEKKFKINSDVQTVVEFYR
ncbi:MAG: VWA domain-containing protein [Sphingobacteriaceae bacterium]|nr:VWA domain-containing protein [Sphingobacteriaceae bacterium]